ncbi:MAG: hypothetical protein HFH60_03635 [Lachnospiraceae bacterium]|jgi:hypothetical protein|nr:hypothetical protein [Lachnospiraceae bacterium]
MKGKTGTNTGTIIHTRKRKKSRRCNCKNCYHARVVGGIANCMLSGDVNVKKSSCKHYIKK